MSSLTLEEARQQPIITIRDERNNVVSVVTPQDLQVGLDGNPGTLLLNGGLDISATIVDISSTQTVTLTHDKIAYFVKKGSKTASVILPSAADQGQMYIVKDYDGSTSLYPITISSENGDLIDNKSSILISAANGAIILIRNGKEWMALSLNSGDGVPSAANMVTWETEPYLPSSKKLVGYSGVTSIVTDTSTIAVNLASLAPSPAASLNTPTSITVDSYGRVTSISGNAIVDGGNRLYTTSSFSVSSQSETKWASQLGNDVYFYVSGTKNLSPTNSAAKRAMFGGDLIVSGGLSGSHTTLVDGTSYLIAGSGIAIASQSNGSVIISAGAGGGDPNATYLTLTTSAILPNERVLTAGTGISVTDAGAGSTATVAIKDSVVATISGSTFTGAVKFNQGLSGSLTQLVNGLSYLVATGNISITSQSNGQIVISGSGGSGGSGTGTLDPSSLVAGPGISIDKTTMPIVISLLPVASQSAIAYHGYASGNTAFHASNWTDFTSALTTYTDNITGSGITRSGATFTVSETGLYRIHSFFNHTANATYIAFRVSSSLGSIIQQTTWQTGGGQVPAIMEGLTKLNANDQFKIQYATKPAAATSWGTSDPIGGPGADTENMHVGEITIYKVADPIVIQSIYSSGSVNYVTASSTAVFATTSSLWDPVPYLTMSIVTHGSPVMLLSNVNYNPNPGWAQFSWFRDGTNLGHNTHGFGIVDGSSSENGFSSITYIDAPASGYHLYEYRVKQGGAGNGEINEASGMVSWVSALELYGAAFMQGPTGSISVSGYVSGTWRDPGNTFVTTGSVSIDSQNRTAAQLGSDVFFYVSGTIGKYDSTGKRSVFGGDLIVSGGLSGSLTKLVDGSSYLVAGTNITIASQSNGQVTISSTASGGADADWIDGGNKLYTTSSVAITSEAIYPTQKGADVYFYVSGTRDLVGSSARKSLFEGDVYISGTLTIGTASINIDSNEVRWNSTTKIYKDGSDLKFFDATNPMGFTLSQLGLNTGTGGGGTGFEVVTSSLNSNITISTYPTWTTVTAITGTYTDVLVIGTYSGISAGTNVVLSRIVIDNITIISGNYTELTTNGSGWNGSVIRRITDLSNSPHTYDLQLARQDAGNVPTINGVSSGTELQGSTLFLLNLSSSGGSTAHVTGTWRDSGNTFVTTGSVSIDASNRTAAQVGSDVFLFVSGTRGLNTSTAKKSFFGGDLITSGTLQIGTAASYVSSSNSNLAFVDNVIPAGVYLAQLQSVYDAWANRPSAGWKGRQFTCWDSPIGQWIDDGTTWRPFVGGIVCDQPAAASTFTSFNAGTTTFTDLSGTLLFVGQNDSTSVINRGYTTTCTGNTMYAEMCLSQFANPSSAASTFSFIALCMREAGTAKSYQFGPVTAHASHYTYLQTDIWSNNTTRTAAVGDASMHLDSGAPYFFRIRRDATNIYAEYSRNRINWITHDSRTIASVFTTAPDSVGLAQLGFQVVPRGNILHFKSGTL